MSVNASQRHVGVAQVITQPKLIQQSKTFEHAVAQKSFSQYCNERVEHCTSQIDENIWKFIKAGSVNVLLLKYYCVVGQL